MSLPRRLRRGLRVVAGVVALAVAVLIGGSVFFAHDPFEIPAAQLAPDVLDPTRPPGLRITYTGVGGYEVTDGETVLLLDPVLTRPTILELASGPVEVDEAAVTAGFPRADFILVNHAHHDHGADAPAIARRTGATIVGSRSMINLALARGVPESQTKVVRGGETLRLGSFEAQVALGDHAPLLGMRFLMRGTIEPDAGPLWFFQYRQDATFAFHLKSPVGELLFHPQAGYIGQKLPPAETVIFGAAGYSLTAETLRDIREHSAPRFLLPTHYDNFFQAKALGMAWLPVVDYENLVSVLDAAEPKLSWWLLDYDRPVVLPGAVTGTVATRTSTAAP